MKKTLKENMWLVWFLLGGTIGICGTILILDVFEEKESTSKVSYQTHLHL